jgi:hypothetical protein
LNPAFPSFQLFNSKSPQSSGELRVSAGATLTQSVVAGISALRALNFKKKTCFDVVFAKHPVMRCPKSAGSWNGWLAFNWQHPEAAKVDAAAA